MQVPAWKDVGVPDIMVRTLRDMKPSYSMDCLVSQLVFHNVKRITSTYRCDACGFSYVPEKVHEEYCSCQSCDSKRVRCHQSVKFSGDKKIPYYTRSENFILTIARQMHINFNSYFKTPADKDIDWEWHEDNPYQSMFHVAFAGGDTGKGELPRIAITRAALLTPYLWDTMYDWKNSCVRQVTDQRFLTNLICHFAPPKER